MLFYLPQRALPAEPWVPQNTSGEPLRILTEIILIVTFYLPFD